MQLNVNGFELAVDVDRHLVDDILLPRLHALSRGGAETAKRRQFVFLAAPPGVGKSTLAAVLEKQATGFNLDTIGIDGFHHPNSYLATNHLPGGGPPVSLSSIKGAPETFDVARLESYLAESADRDLVWPGYDRTLHDVVPGEKLIRAELVLVEGNWLLLDEPAWRSLTIHSAFNIFIEAEPELLSQRLIERKMRGGMDRSSATRFYEVSDRRNIERVLQNTDRRKVDLTLRLNADGSIDQGEAQ